MASGSTGEFYCGTYIRGRFRWSTVAVSGGHNVTVAMDVYRTNYYTGDPISNNRQYDYLYIDGQSSSWYNTTISNERSWHEVFRTTKFVAHTAAKKVVIGWSTTCQPTYYQGQWFMHDDNPWPDNRPIVLEAIGQPASGLSVSPGSKTWNSINVSGSISSWGIGPGPNYTALTVFPGNKSASGYDGPRIEWQATNQGNTKTWSNKGPVNVQLEGGFTIKGCMPYKVGIWADNKFQAVGLIRDTVEYTPPAPPVSAEVISDTPYNHTNTNVTIKTIESSTNNVAGAMVKTKITCTGSGSTITKTSSKHAPGTPVTFELDLLQNKTVDIRVQSIFYYGNNDQYSLVSEEPLLIDNYVTKQIEPPTPEYAWNDDRTALVVTIKANSDYANYMQAKWGYEDDTETILWQGNTGTTPVTSGWSQVVNINYPDHGTGQFIYLKLRSRYVDNTWEDGAVFAIPVMNPIIGVATYTDQNKKYIVDIVEHKANNTITPLWQNGQRIVKK